MHCMSEFILYISFIGSLIYYNKSHYGIAWQSRIGSCISIGHGEQHEPANQSTGNSTGDIHQTRSTYPNYHCRQNSSGKEYILILRNPEEGKSPKSYAKRLCFNETRS